MRRRGWYREPWYARRFEPSRPRAVAGGIKTQVRGGASLESGWARRWIEMLEQFGHGPRLSRGRSYARRGQVCALAVRAGEITASVQGSRPSPYDVSIRLRPIARAKWRAAVRKLPAQLLAAARLLSGEACADLETAFRAARTSLLPEHSRDLVSSCTCPDWGDPCKHVAAVHYVFGAELERDPFLLFTLRGIEREELLAALTGAKPVRREAPRARVKAKRTKAVEPSPPTPRRPAPAGGVPLSCDPATFFKAGPLPTFALADATIPAAHGVHLRPLGNLPFWRGTLPLADALAPIYLAASVAGCVVLLGETTGEGSEEDGGGEVTIGELGAKRGRGR